MNIYIIGPMTGIVDCNRYEFERVKGELDTTRTLGSDGRVRTPFDMVREAQIDQFIDEDDPVTWKAAMRGRLMEMLNYWDYWRGDDCSLGIAMLDGWEQSRGARIEHDLAVSLGIPCKPWREWL